MRPFRFLATAGGYPGFAELTSLARKAGAIGCSTFVLPDHLTGQYGAMPLLAVVAAASERLRVGGPAAVTGDPRSGARRRAGRIREQTGVELTAGEILDSPRVFIGSIKDLARKFADLRERFGISSFLVDDLDVLAPVVGELAGQ